MAREPNVIAKSEPAKTSPTREPAKPKVSTQEAKDLKALIQTLSEKNSPESSKDITVYAKQTLKMVAQSQKSDSAAFKREATKALINFRSFIEKTDKLNESRRAKLLGDIDKTSLDAKSATFMMLSVAKEQAKNIKADAIRAAAADRIRIKQNEKAIIGEAESKAKEINKEAKLKSKAMTTEQTAKMKLIAEERKQKYELMVTNAKATIQAQKDKLKSDKDNMKLSFDTRRQKFEQDKADQKAKMQAAAIQLKQDRDDAAQKIKRLKTDLTDSYRAKVRDNKFASDKAKAEAQVRNKDRIQKIRIMTDDHKIKLKRIQDEAKAEGIITKMRTKEQVEEIQAAAKERKAKHEKNANELTGKVKDGIYDANPLIHAAIEIGSGIVGHLAKRSGDKKKEKALNKLQHNAPTGTPNPTPNATPAPTPPANPVPPPASGGGGSFLGDMVAMLPSITGIVGGIMGFFKEIGSIGKAMGKVLGGAKAIPVIGEVVMIVTALWDFVDGFANAGKLFGEDLGDGNYIKKIFGGMVGVVTGILDLFDTVAGWFGFETDLKGKYEKAAVAVFNFIGDTINSVVDTVKGIFQSVLNAVRSIAGKVGDILEYVPGAGAAAKALKEFSKGSVSGTGAPAAGAAITSKQSEVNDLRDEVDVKKAGGAKVQVVTDNSTKSNTTNIQQAKLDTRNNDSSHNLYGYGAGR